MGKVLAVKKSFGWILLVAIWTMSLPFTEFGLLGSIWIASFVYTLLGMLIHSEYKLILLDD